MARRRRVHPVDCSAPQGEWRRFVLGMVREIVKLIIALRS